MDSTVTLSVLMPVYNEVYTVIDCLRRILKVKCKLISEIEIIIVDDGSTDGTPKLLRKFIKGYPQIIFIQHKFNQGKGQSIRTALEKATKEISIVQDADLEYSPQEYEKLMIPFIKENADAVFGSRFLVGDYCRLLYFKHALVNKFLNLFAGLITDVNFSDIETCYKAVRTRLLKSIPLRSKGFNIEPELCVKLAKRKAVIFEVPISYAGRTKEEGKKIGWRDGVGALFTLIKYWLLDDIYPKDAYGSNILNSLAYAPRFSKWMADTIRPYTGNNILEIGCGNGNLTTYLMPRPRYVASDINPNYLDYFKSYCSDKPYLKAVTIDLQKKEDFIPYQNQFDTVICANVLEHIENDFVGLRNIYKALKPDGRVIILVPHGKWLFSSLDRVLGHCRRYSDDQLIEIMEEAGFHIEKVIKSFNRIGVLAWFFNGKILHRKHFSLFQIKILNMFNGIFRLINHVLPWHGLSTIAVGRKSTNLCDVQNKTY